MSHLKSKYLMLISLIIILIIFSSCSLIFEQVKTPIFNPEEGTFSDYISVEIYSATANATITYTTDGSTPTQNHGTIYTKPITIYKTTTIKAIAYKNLMNDSSVATATFTINKVAPVTFSPNSGTYYSSQLITLSCVTEGATIKYTLNGDDPSPTNGNTYTTPFEIFTTTTIKAMAYKDGMENSDITSTTYTINLNKVAPVTFSPSAGTYSSPQTVTLSCATTGATIKYTLNGDDPSPTNGNTYTTPFEISTTTTIKAMAYKDGMTNSDITSATYNISLPSGSLDTSFSGGDGFANTSIGSNDDFGQSIALQSDGKIVVAGYSYNGTNNDFAVVRYKIDGSLDTSFDVDGIITTDIANQNNFARSLAVQSDGKIVVVGYSYSGTNFDFAVIRYNNDGSLDTSFSSDGIVTTAIESGDDYATSVAIQKDGKIVVIGYCIIGYNYYFAVVRYNTNGSLDTSFDTDGKVTTTIGSSYDQAFSVAIQGDGKIVVAGDSYNGSNYDFAVVRYNSDGTLDTSFGSDGIVITDLSNYDYANSVAIQSDGKIIVVGYCNNGTNDDFAIVRYNTNGSLDTSFDGDGIVITDLSNFDYANSVVIQSDGKIVVIGYCIIGPNYDFAIVRYNSNGSLDTSFGGDGIVITDLSNYDYANSVVIQSDGKIIIAGYCYIGTYSDFVVVRYIN